METFKKIWAACGLLRYKEWQDKVQSITLAAVIAFFLGEQHDIHWQDCLMFLLYVHCPMSYGYLLNAYTDQNKDKKVNKNKLKQASRKTAVWMIMATGVMTLFIPTVFHDQRIMVITMIGFLFTSIYSLKPVRLKERGVWGLITAAVTQRLAFLFLLFLIPSEKPVILYLFFWLLILGFLIETAHQLEDYPNDKSTDSKTYIVCSGIKTGHKLIHTLSILLALYLLFFPLLVFSGTGILLCAVLWLFSYPAFQFAQHSVHTSSRFLL